MALDSEVVNEQGWNGSSFDYSLHVEPSNLEGTLTCPGEYPEVINVGHVPTFLKAMKNIERMFRERYYQKEEM